MGKRIEIETDGFNSVSNAIGKSINNISIAATRKKVTGNMPVLEEYCAVYETLSIAIKEFKEISHENLTKTKAGIEEIHHVDSELIK